MTSPLPVDKATWLGGSRLDGSREDPTGSAVWAGRLGTPVAVLRRSALHHNAATMAAFCERSGAELMPHAKTTMSPALVALQLDQGASGMTAATPHQALQLYDWGVDQVLVANQITDRDELAAVVARRSADRRLWHYVDSAEGLAVAVQAGALAGAGRPVEVLVELGHRGGRTGVRSVEAAVDLAAAVAATPGVDLVGVAGYEGLIGTGRDPESLATVDRFCAELGRLAVAVAPRIAGPPVVTAGGSVWFDRVVAALGPVTARLGGRLVLRSGCYLTHDHGLYRDRSPDATGTWPLAPFRPAVEVWTRVLSRPEPDLVIVNAGRRDLSTDAGLPVPLAVVDRDRPDAGPRVVDGTGGDGADGDGWLATASSDQHLFLTVDPDDPVRPGDLVALGISHPCTTFDKWARFWLIDDDGTVLSPLTTSFG